MNETTPLPPPHARPDLDGMLRAYFRSEMPSPWPGPPVGRRAQKSSPWQRFGARLAVAASVALLLLGYLALAGHFPHEALPTHALPLSGPQIGDRPTHHRVQPRPTSEQPMDQPDWSLSAPAGDRGQR